MIVDCAHYRDGRRQREGPMDLDVAAEVCQREDEQGFVWIRLFEPDSSELAAAVKHLKAVKDFRQAVEDLGWVLINSKEFLFRQ